MSLLPPGFPPPPPKKVQTDAPYREAGRPAPADVPLVRRGGEVELVEPERAIEVPGPDRRLGCVIPLAVLGVAACALGGAFLYSVLGTGHHPSVSLFLCCVGVGPGLLLFAWKVYRDPNF